MAKVLLEQRWNITMLIAKSGNFWAIALFKPRDATPNVSLTTASIPLPLSSMRVAETLRQKLPPLPLR